MNFVIFARNFYPQKDPEAFCSTRFASALAAAGHSVHVVTAEYSEVAEDDPYRKLVHPAMKITRVKAERRAVGNRSGRLDRLKDIDLIHFTVEDWDSHNIGKFTAATKAVLAKYDSPVLITRTYPMTSLYVGWRCRRHAAKWIAHFSDPILDSQTGSFLGKLEKIFRKFWMRRAMKHADAISITCKRVRWFYREQLGSCVDRAKFILATHIGDFKMERRGDSAAGRTEGRQNTNERGERYIYHDGDIYGGRGLQIVEAVDRLNADGYGCLFLQGRDVKGKEDRARLEASPYCRIVGRDAAAELKAMADDAQVSFVSDFNLPRISYSAHLMSKFVYQLFTDRPMVVLSKEESEKHDYCVTYPEAGLFFAKLDDIESLMTAVKAAFACDPKSIDRTRIREVFSEGKIAVDFVNQIG